MKRIGLKRTSGRVTDIMQDDRESGGVNWHELQRVAAKEGAVVVAFDVDDLETGRLPKFCSVEGGRLVARQETAEVDAQPQRR